MIKDCTKKDLEATKIRLELLQQQKGDILHLKNQGVDTTAFEEFIDQMMNDEYTIHSYYAQRF